MLKKTTTKRQILTDLVNINIITILCITSFYNKAKLLSQSYIHVYCAFTWDISKALHKAPLPFPIADVKLYLYRRPQDPLTIWRDFHHNASLQRQIIIFKRPSLFYLYIRINNNNHYLNIHLYFCDKKKYTKIYSM